MTVAVLFARADSVYKTLPGVDVYDIERDARTYDGPWPVVAHPPCTRWSMINGVVLSRYPHKAEEFAWGNDGGTFRFALDTVRRVGGVLEHPAGSRAWQHFGLPRRGRTPDEFGGWTAEIRQVDWGHRAEKRTWLYIVGAGPDDLPPMPAPRRHTAVVVRMPECKTVEIMGKAEREHTPPELAAWLVELAKRCKVNRACTADGRRAASLPIRTPAKGWPSRPTAGAVSRAATHATDSSARQASWAGPSAGGWKTNTPPGRGRRSSPTAPGRPGCHCGKVASRMNKPTKHVVSVSGGKDSLATLLIALERCPREDVIPIFCDTGNEHADTYAYLDYMETVLGVKITRLKADFTEQLWAKRMFIARDQRTQREYDTKPVFEADGVTPVPKRDGRGAIVLNKKGKPVQKTVKVGGGQLVRWSNKAKRRALAVMYPSGNHFLDLCMWKGRFPSRKAQFCTEELKTNMAVAFQLDLMDAGNNVISWQGVRRDESQNRRNATKFERVGRGLRICRPIAFWTAQQVFEFTASRGIKPNPLYLQGMGRVGCMPCINASKPELRAIAMRFPEHPQRISEWETLVGMCSKRGVSTFFSDAHQAQDRREVFADLNIWARIEWSKTTRGGKQFDLLADDAEQSAGCASSYGLCEQWSDLTMWEAA